MTSVSVIKDIFRGEAIDFNQKKQDDCQSVRCTSLIQCILRSMKLKLVEGFFYVWELLQWVESQKNWAGFYMKQQQVFSLFSN